MLSALRRTLFLLALLGLLASNVLTLTSAAFNSALSGALAAGLGVRTVTGTLHAQLRNSQQAAVRNRALAQQRKVAAKQFGRTLVARTQRVAARSVAAIPIESVPYLGAAAVVAGTTYELYAMCQTLQDLELLFASLEIDSDEPDDALAQVCRAAQDMALSSG